MLDQSGAGFALIVSSPRLQRPLSTIFEFPPASPNQCTTLVRINHMESEPPDTFLLSGDPRQGAPAPPVQRTPGWTRLRFSRLRRGPAGWDGGAASALWCCRCRRRFTPRLCSISSTSFRPGILSRGDTRSGLPFPLSPPQCMKVKRERRSPAVSTLPHNRVYQGPSVHGDFPGGRVPGATRLPHDVATRRLPARDRPRGFGQ